MPDITGLSLGRLLACLFNHLLWEYKILFTPTLSGKNLGVKLGLV